MSYTPKYHYYYTHKRREVNKIRDIQAHATVKLTLEFVLYYQYNFQLYQHKLHFLLQYLFLMENFLTKINYNFELQHHYDKLVKQFGTKLIGKEIKTKLDKTHLARG